MPNGRIPTSSIIELHDREGWSVPRIAEHFGVTRQAIYHLLRRDGVVLRKRPRQPRREIAKERLDELYTGESLSIPRVAEVLGCSADLVGKELQRHGIPRRARWSDNVVDTPIDRLRVGESVTVETPDGAFPTTLYKRAKRLGVRVVVRRLKGNTFSVERTPLLTAETVAEMRSEGRTEKEIARIFRATPRTIRTKFPK